MHQLPAEAVAEDVVEVVPAEALLRTLIQTTNGSGKTLAGTTTIAVGPNQLTGMHQLDSMAKHPWSW